MSRQNYLNIVADIRHVCSALSLQLPTHAAAIAKQQRNIQIARQKLERIETRVRLLAGRSWRPSKREQYQALDHLLCSLLSEAVNMSLLAEEFLADPEGSMSCLRTVNQRKDGLLEHLRETEHLFRVDRSNLNVKAVKSFTYEYPNNNRQTIEKIDSRSLSS